MKCAFHASEEHWMISAGACKVIYLVGNWLYVSNGLAFDPEDNETFDTACPAQAADEIARFVCTSVFLREVLMKIKVMQPELKLQHSAEVGQAEVLYAGENTHGNLYAWIQCHANGIKIGVKGSRGQNLFVVGSMLYTSSNVMEEFNHFDNTTYKRIEPFVRDAETIAGKLPSLSVNWLSAKRSSAAPNKNTWKTAR